MGDDVNAVSQGVICLAAFLPVLVLATDGECYVRSVAVLACFELQASA